MTTITRLSRRLDMPQRGQVLRAAYLRQMAELINDVAFKGPRELDGPRDLDGGTEGVQTIISGDVNTAIGRGNIALDEQPDDAAYDTVMVPIVEADGTQSVEIRRQRVVVMIEEGTGLRQTWRLVPPDEEFA